MDPKPPPPPHMHAHPELAVGSISSALALDQQAQQVDSPLSPHSALPEGSDVSARKRKKAENGEESPAVEPRRLRRSHEACARCRSKKIKCDSKHPKCTSCQAAGVQCNQEDRHRKTLTPRGHVEQIERQLVQCRNLLRKHYPTFTLDHLDLLLLNAGLPVEPSPDDYIDTLQAPRPPADGQLPMSARGYGYGPPPHMMPPGFPPPPMGIPPPAGYHAPAGAPYPAGIDPRMYSQPFPALQLAQARQEQDIKGQDPQSNDMSSDEALAKNFGVSPEILDEASKAAASVSEVKIKDNEDLAVGSGGLNSGRDREVIDAGAPRDTKAWSKMAMQHVSVYGSRPREVDIWLPRDKNRTMVVVQTYFSYLNYHRPVLERNKFMERLGYLYEGRSLPYDPGYVCSLYLVLALGTMSELNRSSEPIEDLEYEAPVRKLVAHGWPQHVEFFERALAVKPDLRMTISSLQALILLHWYLYTERQQRSLWRLVGSMVRVAIELGLHHDPFQQGQTFTEEESQLRIRLWAICMIHDRGTSVLLGRPLAIAPADTSTPSPNVRYKGHDYSEHFFLSAPVANLQADIVNALYSPTRHNQEAIMRNSTRIIKSMDDFRKQLPDSYAHFFCGTENWSLENKIKLVEEITEDQGLTLLKIGIARILLLRALFSSPELPIAQRRKALDDAIIVSHNIIVVHTSLIKFPDIAFFVSPIPLHIAAMVILYGHMSKCDRISREVATEDIWYALSMLPRFRWRWERKDMSGGHPLIEKLTEKVLLINLREFKATGTPVLIPEHEWDANSPSSGNSLSPALGSAQSPRNARGSFSGSYAGSHGGVAGDLRHRALAEVPADWFWPMDPENPVELPNETIQVTGQAPAHAQMHQPIGTIGCQPSEEAFMQEEKDEAVTRNTWQSAMMHRHEQQWMNSSHSGSLGA